jgi:RNA polymerase sigma-70 factor (ECF subfamily)
MLLIQIAEGNKEAFWTLWQNYRNYLFGICARHSGGINEEVEDVLSRAMIRAYEKMPLYAGTIKNPKAWLTRLTINLCVDMCRENRRQSLRTTNIDDLEGGDSHPVRSPEDSPEQALIRQEVQSRLDLALSNLPQKVRGPFVLHCLHELGCDEVGKTFSITPANVRKRIQRARFLLRQRLGAAAVGMSALAR